MYARIEKVPTHRRGRVVFVMPRFLHDDVRASHKEAWNVARLGLDVILLCRTAPVSSYLGMQVLEARLWKRPPLLGRLLSSLPLLVQSLRLRADVYVLLNPDTLILGFLLVLLRRRVVYSTHEDFADKVSLYLPKGARWLRTFLGRAICGVEAALTRVNEATVVTQPSVHLKYGPRSLLLPNAPLTWGPIVDQARAYRLPRASGPTLIYAGGITEDRGLFRMLDLLADLRRRRTWRLKLVGPFYDDELLTKASSHEAWPHVDYVGQVPHAASLAHIGTATIGLALLADVGGYARASPNKLYEYMWLGIPFVASDFATWRASIADAPAGLFLDPLDVAAAAEAIDALYQDPALLDAMGRAGREFIAGFNWHSLAQPYAHLVQRLAPARAPAEYYAGPAPRRVP